MGLERLKVTGSVASIVIPLVQRTSLKAPRVDSSVIGPSDARLKRQTLMPLASGWVWSGSRLLTVWLPRRTSFVFWDRVIENSSKGNLQGRFYKT